MDRMFTGRLFQSEGALNLKAFLAVAKVTAGTEKKNCVVGRGKGYHKLFKITRVIEMYTFINKLQPMLMSSY